MIEFFNNSNRTVDLSENQIRLVLQKIISDYGLDLVYINIIFLSDEDLLKMNIQFLGHDDYTDILTFNYSEINNCIEAELYISIDRVIENSETVGDDLLRELSRVIIHGVLHLGGLEDSTPVLKEEMRRLENFYLEMIRFHVKPAM